MPDGGPAALRWGLSAAPPPIAVVTGRGLDPDLPLFTDTETPPIVDHHRARRRARSGPRMRLIAAGTIG